METPEVILNLWYLTDETHHVISLKARAYVATGTDAEKLAFLNSRALLDYLIAEDFLLPQRFNTIVDNEKHHTIAYEAIRNSGMEIDLFEECFTVLEKQFSKLSNLKIGKEPLVSITPLFFDDDYKLWPIENMKKSYL